MFLIALCCSWGFYAHYRLNRLAVFTLPKGMSEFYLNHIDYLTGHAVTPDKLRYIDSTEIPHHYFNADHYGKDPFHTVPQKWDDAVKRYSADTLNKYGTLPWTIQYTYYKLVNAFKNHDTSAVLRTSAFLGHYVADACVPLHLTQNHDGQLTQQEGIHALWESRLPEQFGQQYNYYVGKARYLDNPLWQAFIICRSSFKCVDSVLRIERQLNKTFPPDQKYTTVQRGKRKITDYSPAYCRAYQKALNGMVQRRMRMAVLNIGSYWYSAWVDAGQPDLNKMIDTPLTITQKQKLAQEQLLYKSGHVILLPPSFGITNKIITEATSGRAAAKPAF
ncbi:zinc dependent phospholipase C family protein [Mucilaginibacter lacusdianchii]|uniref:zinc dependent phospholipase C family protein n=1 Tax=Mucilaginibacter lacusdianchii TaxID=2684211 RepID=UPI0018EF15F5|nr:zinc dependent phospholipase C family protein [Mucilaginibacter sp. JXJ CY 39]